MFGLSGIGTLSLGRTPRLTVGARSSARRTSVLAGQFTVQAVDAGWAEEIQAVISDLPLDELILVIRLPA